MGLSRARVLVVPAVLAVMLLTGCGGNNSSTDSGESSPASSTSSSKPASAEVMAPCEAISTADVGAVLGATVTAETDPNGGCRWAQEDPRAPSVGIYAIPGGPGTSNEAKSGNATSGDIENITGVGDEAWIAIGTTPGGENQQGQGAIQVGNQVINVTLIQGKGLDTGAVRELLTKVMELAAAKA